MGKLDKAKEGLNNLRLYLTISIAVLTAMVSWLVSSFERQNFTFVYWLGLDVAFLLVLVIALLFKQLNKKTDDIERL